MPDRWLRVPGRRAGGGEPDLALERLVVEAGSLVDFPALPDLSVAVGRRLRQAPTPSRWSAGSLRLRLRGALRPVLQPAWQPVAVALIVIVAFLSGTLAVSPTARRAVAGWLGLRGVRIHLTPAPSPPKLPIGTNLDLGERMTLSGAQARVPFPILVPHDPQLGPPDEVYLRAGSIENQVTLVWRAQPGLPQAHATRVGLLLTEFRGSLDRPLLEKTVFQSTFLEPVRVNGGEGYWIGGAHEVYVLDEQGRPIKDTVRLSANALLWEKGDLTLRLESELTKERSLSIAATVR